MSSFIESYKELDGFGNTCMNLSLYYCISINMMHIYTNNLNNTNNSINVIYLFVRLFPKEIKCKISCTTDNDDVFTINFVL